MSQQLLLFAINVWQHLSANRNCSEEKNSVVSKH